MKKRSNAAADHFAVVDTTALAVAVVAVADAPPLTTPPDPAAPSRAVSKRGRRGRRTSPPASIAIVGAILNWWSRGLHRLVGR